MDQIITLTSYGRLCQELLKSGLEEEASYRLLEVEAVHAIQNMLIFAPHSLDARATYPYLLARLTSPVVGVKSMAIECISHLIQRDTDLLRTEQGATPLEKILFGMIDLDDNASLTESIVALLDLVVNEVGPEEPGRIVMQCRAAIIGGSTQSKVRKQAVEAPLPPNSTEAMEGMEEDDEEGDIDMRDAVPVEGSDQKPASRWQCKEVAAVLLVKFIRAMAVGACQTEPRHCDLGIARDSGLDGLVLHLNDLVSTAFTCATGTIEKLQPVGLELLTEVLHPVLNAICTPFNAGFHAVSTQCNARLTLFER